MAWRTAAGSSPPSLQPASRRRRALARRTCACSAQPPASSLDTWASTVQRVKAELPYLRSPELAAERIQYSFCDSLHKASGREAYCKLQEYWHANVPERLGANLRVRSRDPSLSPRPSPSPLLRQYELVKTFQPDAATLVVRWRLRWEFLPPGWSPLEPPPPLEQDEHLLALEQRLADTQSALQAAAAALPPGSAEAASQLAAAETQLAAGRSALSLLSQQLAVEADPLGYRLQELRAQLDCVVLGTSTLTLDADGCVLTHADTLDFEAVKEAELREELAPAPGGEDAASLTESVYTWCLAHRPPEAGFWGWRLDVTRQMLWESFQRDANIDEEVKMVLGREEFDELVLLFFVASAWGTRSSTALTPTLTPPLPSPSQRRGGLAVHLPDCVDLLCRPRAAAADPERASGGG